jgi:hypothetical protein
MLVLGGISARAYFRTTTKVPPHLPGPAWERLAGKAVHGLMYPMMALIPLTGVAMGYFGGGGIPFLGTRILGKVRAQRDARAPRQSRLAPAQSQGRTYPRSDVLPYIGDIAISCPDIDRQRCLRRPRPAATACFRLLVPSSACSRPLAPAQDDPKKEDMELAKDNVDWHKTLGYSALVADH